MALPLKPPILPQLARSRESLPDGEGWAYEPKYDGFRCVAYVDGDEIELQSRNGKTLTRYFPEVVASFPSGRYVLDGEIVASSFDTLGQRIHPAKSRVERLSVETPARFIAFDLLARGDMVLLEHSYDDRRATLEKLDGIEVAPVVRTAQDAQGWLQTEEGVIAKQSDEPYRPGERVGMVKIKRVRTADCVVVGWRPGKAEGTLGALILGMYDGDRLREVGHSSGFSAKEKRELPAKMSPYETGERGSGEPSRWNSSRPPRDLEWIALRPELVVEITFDHTSDGRIRHGAKVQRWREDKDPRECTYDQLEG
jgi:ATP-dependent DNA ligase